MGAAQLGVAEGDVVRVESPRGAIEVRARVRQVMPGAGFAPFHFSSWDLDSTAPAAQSRQANELTMMVWDPVKQPYFQTAACRVTKVRDGNGATPEPTTAASAPAAAGLPPTRGGSPTVSVRVQPTPHHPNDPALGSDAPDPTTTIAGRSS